MTMEIWDLTGTLGSSLGTEVGDWALPIINPHSGLGFILISLFFGKGKGKAYKHSVNIYLLVKSFPLLPIPISLGLLLLADT